MDNLGQSEMPDNGVVSLLKTQWLFNEGMGIFDGKMFVIRRQFC
jgi:hypothetical protein